MLLIAIVLLTTYIELLIYIISKQHYLLATYKTDSEAIKIALTHASDRRETLILTLAPIVSAISEGAMLTVSSPEPVELT